MPILVINCGFGRRGQFDIMSKNRLDFDVGPNRDDQIPGIMSIKILVVYPFLALVLHLNDPNNNKEMPK